MVSVSQRDVMVTVMFCTKWAVKFGSVVSSLMLQRHFPAFDSPKDPQGLLALVQIMVDETHFVPDLVRRRASATQT